ncbi:SDR family NAD(P)-dependent oxidoreductase [Actinophytocola oryzae]|uniref:NAD(P)-dependent dehydrogenase (Short-subunit alcohol dehydrogenase family) n=1 Tax=Actinophytocola oryzae TaxID=502181 RepID=A0A4R7VND2_9PSEU|nr:SDR family NAD(P)-dependent oxidoreductase [Actinophytocola oryzae]TDV50855.1 NAD(P)-dependent dehydrogenase (short-subunit alcohol dehydrogenase family) [Actinophytocola oryzae]
MIVFVTGATDGLGRALADRLASDGHTLILHGRHAGRLADTAAAIKDRAEVHTALADLADLRQVRGLAAQVRQLTDRLDVLVNNAGIGSGMPVGRERATSVDGHELRFAVNYLAGFLLSLELLPLLRSSAPARIVNVASLGQHPLDFDDLMLERDYSGGRAYSQSKLAQVMSGFELASRLPAAEVTVNSLHPGTYMPTKMVVDEIGYSVDSLETGVASTSRLAVGAEVAGVTGRFFDRQRDARADEQAYDPSARSELWRRSLALVDHADVV